MNQKTKAIIEILIIVLLFISLSYIIQTNIESIRNIIGDGYDSMLFYILMTVVAVVIAPISATPLLPLASNLWGWLIAAILSIIGWTIGSLIAFVLARIYGLLIIRKFIPIERIRDIEKKIPDENIFWSIVFLRMILPVDLLSYALGIFSKINTRDYLLATIIGVAPFAFVFAYLGEMPILYQIISFLIAMIILLIGFIIKKIRDKKKIKKR
ncbi:MAG: VTT domain-containing protein [Candidatus Pacearchaeota archaeon]|jgi:uncharacterized membrane protein YdjX (TVP38/TMEM64 family)|nr:hypothetical protein [Candidatus Pacearchaeota archaeon]MDP7520993.1 VTT domain-containing protein [Candidatus Pacearchaeota archaeon]|tara:strand:+ start:144 stop:779 length:636 start_codon:yes stop_codon:yes gene_type:complete